MKKPAVLFSLLFLVALVPSALSLSACTADYDWNGVVNSDDVRFIGLYLNKNAAENCGDSICGRYDGNQNGVIDQGDSGIVNQFWHQTCPVHTTDYDRTKLLCGRFPNEERFVNMRLGEEITLSDGTRYKITQLAASGSGYTSPFAAMSVADATHDWTSVGSGVQCTGGAGYLGKVMPFYRFVKIVPQEGYVSVSFSLTNPFDLPVSDCAPVENEFAYDQKLLLGEEITEPLSKTVITPFRFDGSKEMRFLFQYADGSEAQAAKIDEGNDFVLKGIKVRLCKIWTDANDNHFAVARFGRASGQELPTPIPTATPIPGCSVLVDQEKFVEKMKVGDQVTLSDGRAFKLTKISKEAAGTFASLSSWLDQESVDYGKLLNPSLSVGWNVVASTIKCSAVGFNLKKNGPRYYVKFANIVYSSIEGESYASVSFSLSSPKLTASPTPVRPTPVSTVVPVGTSLYKIELQQGWNLVSFPLTRFNAKDSNVVENTCEKTSVFHLISLSRSSASSSENGKYQIVDLSKYVRNGEGYWIKSSADCSITLQGTPWEIKPSGYMQNGPSLSLWKGWNQFGVPYGSYSWKEVKNNCDVKSGPWTWENNAWKKATILEEGKGYFVKTSKDCDLDFSGQSEEMPPLPE